MSHSFVVFSLLVIFLLSCVEEQEMVYNNPKDPGSEVYEKTMTDIRDGEVYQTVIIGAQTWMSENLRYLPQVNALIWGAEVSGKETSSFYYVYDYAPTGNTTYEEIANAKATANYQTYGVLYNWNAAMGGATSSELSPSGIQGVCPNGCHLPSDAEWEDLALFIAFESGLTNKDDEIWTQTGSLLKANSKLWSLNTGTDNYGFAGLPGGLRFVAMGSSIGEYSYWWSSTENSNITGYTRLLNYDSDAFVRYNFDKKAGLSVRCLKD